MSILLAFFGVSPAAATRFLALLIGTAIAIAVAGATGFAAGWKVNGWRLGVAVAKLETRVVAAVDQGKILAAAVEACSAGVEEARVAGQGARALGAQLLDEARRIGAPARAQADRIEALLKKAPPPGAKCGEAWAEIQQDRKAGATR